MAKVSKTFRLPQELINAANLRAKIQNRTLTNYLETLIMKDIELNPEIDTIDVFIAEDPNERQIVEHEDGMTNEEVERDQRIIDRITGHRED